MNIIKVKDYTELSKVAANIFHNTIDKKGTHEVVINTTTGASYDGMFKLLVDDINNKKLFINNTVITNLDEYVANRNDKFTVYRYMYENFYNLINQSPKYVGLLNGSTEDIEGEIERYKKVLQSHPRDLQILGLGVNGHLGANEPGTSFKSSLFLANSDESTIQSTMNYQGLNRSEAPTQMLTLGLSDIMEAKEILLVASGERKAKAVQKTIEGTISESCPATILRNHPNVTFIIDEEASKYLKS
ncbi:glucosamine-6-phosphate deaminase [Staphylococcus nepalensis]|uniref:Glucosamine-6-phosphate isomerase n=1 Tax=Staphylococcus nepalensis TaxID=214473 RepID=A0A380GRB8_9STAP|nr:glucosamine-6-phosphate deaminase [Staphylococcus nepalensis]VDG68299.1 glucosamine-6-phosphate isomerase [Lacrimispora indolis]MDR5649545.1 glucosamine-6-phosphate deaminase [Staphylococcus nepalensis]PNZ95059.1 glucosamine-6-phosphate deaminase [Staphylococcus nepalensis]SUM56323.1 glucosamine-6-phosphate isomerase [Staphylococcus nepalensis]GGB82512.1 glucosamine-6-phosphate deaminase [Staphylococcus nepalensis]